MVRATRCAVARKELRNGLRNRLREIYCTVLA
jgi:hypothetical protein